MNVAISDSPGVGTLILGRHNTGRSFLEPRGLALADDQETDRIEVPIITGDELLERARLDRVDLIKIDVEGHEEAVLVALSQLIDSKKPRAIVFEHFGDLRTSDSCICRIFDALGYEIRAIQKRLIKWRLVPITDAARWGFSCHDYVALRLSTASSS